eukprot:Stramenopile-MAST_4_protein_1472
MCTIDTTPPQIPKRLLHDPFTGDDEVVRTFEFQNEKSFSTHVGVDFKTVKVRTCLLSITPFPPLFLCTPCIPQYIEKQKELIRVNRVEELWCRRLAVTKNGVVYKQLPRHPMGGDPANCMTGCCCQYEQHEALEKGAEAKTIPFEKIQDVKVTGAQGATVINYCGCCCSDTFKNVDVKVEVDTSGEGIELTLYGIKAPDHFKKVVLAMKNGRPLPDIPIDLEGVSGGSTSVMSYAAAARRPTREVAPTTVEMSRIGISLPRGGNTDPALVAAIERQNKILAEHTQLLKIIATNTGKI